MLFTRRLLMRYFWGFGDGGVSPYLKFRFRIILIDQGLITCGHFTKYYPKIGTDLQGLNQF